VSSVTIRIAGVNLPGRNWGGYENIHVGVQRKAEPVELVPGDAAEAAWEFPVDLTAEGDFRGPYVQGRRGERFIYLTWGAVDAAGTFSRFRRAKLMLAGLEPEPGQMLHGELSLTGGDGGPRCASVRPPAISWTVAPAD
jgi:hypothetical protein